MTLKDFLAIICCLCIIMLVSCARQGRPSGGPKDTIPPAVLNTYPTIGATNFNEKELEIEFDEYIEVKNLKKELIINPNIKDYKYYTRKQKLVIRLEEDLNDSTTYTFNVRQAVVDFENNSAKNALLAFSTGEKLDSMQVVGNVKEILTQQPANDVVVGLYRKDDTTTILNGAPLYFTKTNENGFYNINYIKNGIYDIYAWNDLNNNLKYESNNETIAFNDTATYLVTDSVQQISLPDSLKIGKNIGYGQSIDLNLFKKDIRPIKVQSSRPDGRYYEIKFNKPLKSYTLTVDSGDVEETTKTYLYDSLGLIQKDSSLNYVLSNFQDQQQTIRIYNTLKQDSLLIQLGALDSASQTLEDTILYVRFTETRRKPEPLTQQLIVEQTDIVDSIAGTITFNKPIIDINTDSILLVYDTLLSIPINYNDFFTWNEHRDKATFGWQINKDTLIDEIMAQSIINDSIVFAKESALSVLYIDSIKSETNVDEKFKLLEALNNLQYEEGRSQMLDSIQNIEDDILRQNMIGQMADTITAERDFKPNSYTKEEIKNSIGPLTLYMSPGSFLSVEKDSSEVVRQDYSFLNPDDYGVVKGKITTDQSKYFIQLIDNSFNVIAERYSQDRYTFINIAPGSYKIRVLVDSNENGKWEEGNILENKEPEPVIIFNDEVNLKAGWELDLSLVF